MLLMLTCISLLKLELQHLWRLFYGQLQMAKLPEPLMGIRDTGKVQNQKVPSGTPARYKTRKCQTRWLFFLFLLLTKSLRSYNSHHSSTCTCRYNSKNNTNKLHLLISSAFRWTRIDGITYFLIHMACKLTTAAPYWGIHFFTTKTMVS